MKLPTDPHLPFRDMLRQSRERLDELTVKRDEAVNTVAVCEKEIVQVRRVIVSLAAMLGEAAEMEAIGITEAVRTVMLTANMPLRLRQVCEQLVHAGFDPNSQENLSPSVQSVLNRLHEKKEIAKVNVDLPTGKSVIVYIGPNVTKAQSKETLATIKSTGA